MNEQISAGWRLPGIMKGINAQDAYNEIYGNGENHTLSEIVDMARNKDSSMHKYFEWDNKTASEEYRKIQAQRLVKNFVLVKIEPETKKEEKTTFRLVEATSDRNNTYAPVKFFLQNRDEYSDLLHRAMIELEGFRKRYSNLVELDSIFAEIDTLLSVS